MSRFWSPLVHDLQPYVAGEQPVMAGIVKLNTNENPYGPSPRALRAIRAEATDTLRLYPDPTSLRLREAVAAHHGLKADQIFVGNSSDEVLALVFQALLKHERPLAFPDVTYSFYPVWCSLYGIAFREIPLDADMRIDISTYGADCGAIVFANPNAPTGIALSRQQIETLLRANPDKPVVIDEAYVDFGAESAIPLIGRYPNLLVVHTLSKSRALAGLRVGLAMGQRPLIDALERVKDSFNSYPLDRLAQAGAQAAYEDVEWFEATRAKVIASRERLAAALASFGFEVLPSRANFLFVRHPTHEAVDLANSLREQSIIVRYFNRPRTKDFLRITVGTKPQCDRLISVLRELIRWNALQPSAKSALRWYIVHAYSSFEKKVAESIKDQAAQRGLADKFEEVLVPAEQVIDVRRGRKFNSERKFFPGYVLVKCDLTDQVYHLIKNTPKVTGFLGPDNKPMPISEAETDRIKGQVTEGVVRSKSTISFKIGETKRAAPSPLSSVRGKLEEVEVGRSRRKSRSRTSAPTD